MEIKINMSVQQENIQKTKQTIQWEVLEYEHKEHSVDWFWAIGLITISIAVVSFIYENFLFAVFIIIASFAIIIHAIKKPNLLKLKITSRGFVVNDKLYPYSNLKSFGIKNGREGTYKLIIQSKALLTPYIIVPLTVTNEEEVRDYLKKYLPEEEHEEPLAHAMMDYLGF